MYPGNNNGNISSTSCTNYNINPFSSSSHLIYSIEDGTFFNEQLLGQDNNNLLLYAHNNHNNNNNTNKNDVVIHDENFSSSHDLNSKCGNNIHNGTGFNYKSTETRCTIKKRSSSSVSNNKDRHSKIMTARGPRDRRMRLSLDASNKFFKLQDILGFDKASETVNWLLVNSKSDIQELLTSHRRSSLFSGVSNSASSTSNCELLVTNNDINNDDDEQKAKSSSCSSNLKEKKRANKTRKSSYLFRPLAKETREMARKRARDRTLEKTTSKCLDLAMNNQDNANRYSNINYQLPENLTSHFQLIQQGYIGDNSSSSMADNWNDTSNYFLMNNQPDGGGVLPHERQLNYIQRLGRCLWGDNN